MLKLINNFLLQSDRLYNFNVNRAKVLRKNTENMMFHQLRLKLPTEQLVARLSENAKTINELPGFAVSHESGKSDIIVFERSKMNYVYKFVFEAFFPHTNDFFIKKVLYVGLILDTKKYYKLNIEVFQELMLARDITLIQNEEEMQLQYEFLFTNDSNVIEEAKKSLLSIKDKSYNLIRKPEVADLDFGEKLHNDAVYDEKIKPNAGTRIFPTINSNNYDIIKRDLVEKKLFRRFKLKRPKEKLVVNTDVFTGKIINYPGFDLIHSYSKTHLIVNDKELLNYFLKFVYEMFCPRETPSLVNLYLYKAIRIHDITFTDIDEYDFERIYPLMKNANYITLIHNELHNPTHYLFTFVEGPNARSNDPANVNPLFLYDPDDNKAEDVDNVETQYEREDLYDMSLYKHPPIEGESKEKQLDLLPNILTTSRFKIEALNDAFLESQEWEEKTTDSDEDIDDDFDEEKEYAGLDNDQIDIKRKERKFFKRQKQYLQTVNSLVLKYAQEKGPIGYVEENLERKQNQEDIQITLAPVSRVYKTKLGPSLSKLGKKNLPFGPNTTPIYGDSDLLGFTLQHSIGFTVVDINFEAKNRDSLLKFLCSILLFKDIPEMIFERVPYTHIILDEKPFSELTEEFIKLSLTAKEIKLVWREDTYAPAYHL